MPTNNREKQTASSNASPTSSKENSNGENTSLDGVNGDALLLSLTKVARELHGQFQGIVERLCQTIAEESQGQVLLILERYQYRHTQSNSSVEGQWLNLSVEHAGRSYGKLAVAPHPEQSGQPALQYQHIQSLAINCALLLYSLETAAYFQREYPSPAKLTKELTPREQEILELLCSGYSRKQIAASLKIETGTIAKMCGLLYKHLGVRTERQAIAAAFILGLSFPIKNLSPEITSPPARQTT